MTMEGPLTQLQYENRRIIYQLDKKVYFLP